MLLMLALVCQRVCKYMGDASTPKTDIAHSTSVRGCMCMFSGE